MFFWIFGIQEVINSTRFRPGSMFSVKVIDVNMRAKIPSPATAATAFNL